MEVQYKLAQLMSDGIFQGAMRILVTEAAVNILPEAQGGNTADEWNARRALCKKVISNNYGIQEFLPSILSDSTIKAAVAAAAENVEAWRDAVTAADVNTRLGGVWTQLATA